MGLDKDSLIRQQRKH